MAEPVRVLIIDDLLSNTLLLEGLVGTLDGVTPTGFNDPAEAVEWCRTNEPDLVLLDYIMPQLSGLEVLRRLRGMPHLKDIPVIVVTALEDRKSRLEALEAGANDFVTKPFDELELLARSRSMLKLRAASRELQRLATTDELTGLPNRRHFLARLKEESDRATRFRERSLSVAMADADHFKRVNDTYGHAAGDAVLRKIAEIFRSAIRTIDVPGRLGGEEFGIIMPDTHLPAAQLVCERLRQQVESSMVELDSVEIRVTISLGVAELNEGEHPERLLARADSALYLAKDSGRNRTCT